MIPISNKKVEAIIKLFKDDSNSHIELVKNKLTKLIKEKKFKIKGKDYKINIQQELYLRYLRSKLKDIVYSHQSKLNIYSNIFDKIIPNSEKGRGFSFIPFKNKLIIILGYELLRSDIEKNIYPLYFKKLGMKACVYCNSQLTITAIKEKKKLVARFQVDHFIDKAKYPCFSISFFNLYPVCASCNNKKGNKEVGFNLYSELPKHKINSEYLFSIDKKSLVEFRLSKDENCLNIHFNDNGHKLNETFAINGIYETQKDIAVELIIKSEIYNKSYKESLKNTFTKLYGKNGVKNLDFNRFILGNYTNSNDIHKRPLAKFTQDIAKQLKLI